MHTSLIVVLVLVVIVLWVIAVHLILRKARRVADVSDETLKSNQKIARKRALYVFYLQRRLNHAGVSYMQEADWHEDEETRKFNEKVGEGL